MRIYSILKSLLENKKKTLILLIVFSVSVSTFYVLMFSKFAPSQLLEPGTDYQTYSKVAEALIGSNQNIKDYDRSSRYPIGHPLYLTMIYYFSELSGIELREMIVIINILISALSVCLIFLIAESFMLKKIAFFSSILFATYPFFLFFIYNPHSEVPFILLFLLSVLFFIKMLQKSSFKYVFLAGFFLGLSSLVRPIVFILPLFTIVFIIINFRKRMRIAFLLSTIFMLAYIITIMPWIVYLYLSTGTFISLSTGAPPAIADGLKHLINPGVRGDLIQLPTDVHELILQAESAGNDSSIELIKFFFRSLFSYPFAMGKLILIKIFRSWYATSQMWFEWQIAFTQILYIVPSVFGFYLFWNRVKKVDKMILTYLLLLIGYFWLASITVLSILRYMVPVMGFIIIFTTYGIFEMFNYKSKNIK